ncbi:MAG: Fe(2+)-trafficking protein [Planctomycetota bacterium]
MDLDQRIAQFENMANADPDNEMAHFSLGGAYAQAGRHQDAADAYQRALQVQPDLSKAYQLAAEQLEKAGDAAGAADLASRGYVVAAENGDLMPKKAIAEMLERFGAPLPEVANEKKIEIAEGSFLCRKSGRPGHQLPRPPFRGPIGQWIHENISQSTWDEWIGQGTKVINELRLDLSRDEDCDTYDRYMHEFLEISDDLLAELRGDAPVEIDEDRE